MDFGLSEVIRRIATMRYRFSDVGIALINPTPVRTNAASFANRPEPFLMKLGLEWERIERLKTQGVIA